jgi:hypothetical protein
MPLVFGCSAISLSAIYTLQRFGLPGPHSFDNGVQHHLDAIGISALALAGFGIALGLCLGHGGRRMALPLWGMMISVAGALAQLLLSL